MKIQVQAVQINALRSKLAGVKNKSADIAGNVARTKGNLDWQVASRSGIDTRLAELQRRIQRQTDLMGSYTVFLNAVNSQFEAKDGELRNKARGTLYQLGQVRAGMSVIARLQAKVNHKTDVKLTGTMRAASQFGAKPIQTASLLSLGSIFTKVKEFFGKFFSGGKIQTGTFDSGEKSNTQNVSILEPVKDMIKVMTGDITEKSQEELLQMSLKLEKMRENYADNPSLLEKIEERLALVNGSLPVLNEDISGKSRFVLQ